MDISVFNQEPEQENPSLSEFFTGGKEPTPLVNKPTASNLAAHAAALSKSEDLKQTYDSVNEELNYGNSPTLDKLLDEYDREEYHSQRSVLRDIMLDPDLSPEVKAEAGQRFLEVKNDSMAARLGRESLAADSDPEEVYAEELIRIDTSEILDEVDVYNGLVQNEMNIIDKASPTRVDQKIEEFVLTLVPFYEGAKFTQISKEIDEATGEERSRSVFKALTMLGHEKEKMRNVLKAMPVNQRTKVARILLDYAKDDLNVHSMRGNKMLMMRNLEEMLGAGSYSNTDKWIDTASSLIDAVLPVFPAAKGAIKGAKVLSKAGSVAARSKRYNAAIKRLEEKDISTNLTKMQDAVKNTKSPEAKAATIKSTEDIIVDDVLESVGEVGQDVAGTVRASVQKNVKDIETTDIIEVRARIVEDVKKDLATKSLDEGRGSIRDNVVVDYIRSKASSVSISSVLKDTNPNKARQLDKLIVDSKSDETAQLLAGTNRSDAIVDNRALQIAKQDGTVNNKVDVYDGHAAGKDMISDIKQTSGRLELSTAEKRGLRNEITNDFRGVAGVNLRTAMSDIKHTDQGVKMGMVYAPKNSGYRSAQRAVDDVVRALRKWGVDHSDVQILKRTGEGYVPADRAKRGIKDYVVKVDMDYNFRSTDLKNFDRVDNKSKWRMFDVSIPVFGKVGLIPQSVIMDNLLFKSAVVAADKSAYIQRKVLNFAKDYAKSYQKLDSRQKRLVTDYIIEANEKGLKLDPTSLEVKGFNSASINVIRQWRQVNDVIYELDNWDMNKTLRGRGYQKVVSKKGDIDLIAAPLKRSQISKGTKVYDPTSNKTLEPTQGELDQLYDSGGSVFKNRGPVEVDGEMVDFVIVNQETIYSRAIKDTDVTLAYRDGHYHVDYNDKIFITQKFTDSSGTTYDKAIATAPSRQEAIEYVAKLAMDQNKNPTEDFMIRYDKKGSTEYEDLEWSMTVNMGRSTQKVRGQRLADSRASSDVTMNHSHIESPEESLLKSVQSISNRTAYRDWIDTSKQRFLDQFGHLLERKGMWPEDASKIKAGDLRADASEIRNAKSTWEYINSIEDGYTDLLNDATKYLFKAASDVTGRAGFGWLEKASRKGEDLDINKFARRKAFRILLASNPFQFITQYSQALPIVGSLNPSFLIKVPGQLAFLRAIDSGVDASGAVKGLGEKISGLSTKQATEMAEHYKKSGIAENVSAHSFMREHLHSLVDRTAGQKAGGLVGKPIDFLQKIGFEMGEQALMSTVWLSEYDLLRKAGTKMTPEVLDNLNAKVRALTGDMNRAGEMAYNQNMFSAVAQFWSTPHKIFAQLFMGHKGLTKTERSKLAAGYLLTYGTGYGYLSEYVYNMYKDVTGDEIPQDVADAVETGLFQFALNGALSTMYGDNVDVGFSERFRIGIAQPNFVRFMQDMVELNVPTMISNSASGSMIFGHSPKFTTFLNETMRMFVVPSHETKEQAFNAAKSFLVMFPTMSNSFKAHYIIQWAKENEGKGRSIGRTGTLLDDDVNTVEALMKVAGFSTMDELSKYRLSDKLYREGSKPYDDVKEMIKETNIRLSLQGIAKGDVESTLAIMAEAQRVFGTHPAYNKIVMNELKSQAENSDNNLLRKLMTMAQVGDEHGLENLLRSTELDENTKEFLRTLQKGINE